MKKIVITGPESTGKTSVATYLGKKFNIPVVNEYAVEYLNKTSGKYKYPDLLKIARGQIKSEDHLMQSMNPPILICDTDLITIKIWSEVRFNKTSREIMSIIANRHYVLYILCAPDIEWEYAEFRENPDDRDFLFGLYEKELIEYNKNYTILTGMGQERFLNAERIVNDFLKKTN